MDKNIYKAIARVAGLEYIEQRNHGRQYLRTGNQIIRNERGWRDNEKYIDYIWITRICKSFIGEIYLFSIKFDHSKFRDMENPEELMLGILNFVNFNTKEDIDHYYVESRKQDFTDPIRIASFDLFGNKGIQLDGASYDITIMSGESMAKIQMGGIFSPEWKIVEGHIVELGKRLAINSKNEFYMRFFNHY